MTKIYPDNVYAKMMRDEGKNVRLMWEMKGPPHTDVAWLSCYIINGWLEIVETFKSGGFIVLKQSSD